MRKLARHGAPVRILARAWGVEVTTAGQAIHGHTWAWLTDNGDGELGPPPDNFDDLSDINKRVVEADPVTKA
jgi:hypothetical protein